MKMEKKISTFDIFCIASGVMISSGIFILPGIAFTKAGPAVFLSYSVAGIAALLGVLSIIELSTAMPKAGGDYFFITRSLGPLLGLIIGFFSWFSLSLKTAFAIFGISEILYSITGFSQIILAIAVALFFIALNIKGVAFSEKYNSVKAVFVLIGSSDERQFHLQALSSIAQIIHNEYFEKQWLEAKSIRNLKDICLLSDRIRNV